MVKIILSEKARTLEADRFESLGWYKTGEYRSRCFRLQ